MTDTNNNQAAASKAPDYIAYHVRGKKGEKGFFTRIGAAWATQNGDGLNIVLQAHPIDGRITLLAPSEKQDRE